MIAQPDYFEQPVKVNVDTTDYVLGEYGVIVNNLDTGDSISNFYTNSEERLSLSNHGRKYFRT